MKFVEIDSKNSAYNHENMDLIDITEGAIYNTWKELVDRYDIFVFDSEESKRIDDYKYGENDGYTCNFLVVEYDEHEIITQYFIWNGYSTITKELLVILEQVKKDHMKNPLFIVQLKWIKDLFFYGDEVIMTLTYSFRLKPINMLLWHYRRFSTM